MKYIETNAKDKLDVFNLFEQIIEKYQNEYLQIDSEKHKEKTEKERQCVMM